MLLAGLWALILGRITITRKLRLRGRKARLYGVTLIAAAFVVPFLLGPLVPPTVSEFGGPIGLLVSAAVAAAVIVGLALPFRDKPTSAGP